MRRQFPDRSTRQLCRSREFFLRGGQAADGHRQVVALLKEPLSVTSLLFVATGAPGYDARTTWKLRRRSRAARSESIVSMTAVMKAGSVAARTLPW